VDAAVVEREPEERAHCGVGDAASDARSRHDDESHGDGPGCSEPCRMESLAVEARDHENPTDVVEVERETGQDRGATGFALGVAVLRSGRTPPRRIRDAYLAGSRE
jgi:hypothetical protein